MMKKYDAHPEDWICPVRLSHIGRTGEVYSESFKLPLDGAIEHWGQIYTSLGPVCADVEANYSNERILAKVTVRASFTLPCSRCLSDTGLAILGDLRYLFSLRPEREETEDDSGGAGTKRKKASGDVDGDIDVIPVDSFQGEIDFAPYVWEVLILSLPDRIVCKDDCAGLCPACGANRNESDCGCTEDGRDPRFDVLRDLE